MTGKGQLGRPGILRGRHFIRCVGALCLWLAPAIAYAQTGTISGAVTDAGTGAGLSGFVQVYSWNGQGIGGASTTAGSGAYTIPNLVPGIYFARTFLSSTLNYVAEAYNDVRCAPSCAITTTTPIYVVGGATTIVNFGLSPGAMVSGVVTDEVTLAGVVGVFAILIDANGFGFSSNATLAGGGWSIAGVPPGTYYAQTSAPSTYINELYNNISCNPFCPSFLTGTPIPVGTAPVTGINFALAPASAAAPGGISGLVSVVTIAGPTVAVPNANVFLYNSSGSQIRTVVADGSGNYSITGLAAGTYYARTAVLANVNAIDEAHSNIPCVPCPAITSTTPIVVGTTTVTVNFPLAAGGSITGAVVDQSTFVGVSSASVSVLATTGQTLKTVPADVTTGAWTATGLPTGSYLARTNLSTNLNYIPEAWNNIPCLPCPSTATWTLIGVSGTTTTVGINFLLAPGGTVSGTVTDARTGAPGPNINISIYSSTGAFVKSGFADINGNYSVVGLPTGVHYARTGFSNTYVSKLYNNILCPYTACSVLNGAALGVAQGGTVSGINFALTPQGAADVMVTFGAPYGLWRYGSDNKWTSIHPASPLSTATGDFDGNGHDDLAVNFGAPYGVYAWMNHATWQFIHPASPSVMAAGDLDNNGNDDLILVFPGYGVWRWVNTGAFNQIHGGDATKLAVGDIDGPGADDLVLDFPGYGLWLLSNNATFSQLHALNAASLAVADINGSGRDDVVVGFTGYGLYAYRDNPAPGWVVLHALAPLLLAPGRLDTSTGEDLVVDFGAPYGLYALRNGATWSVLHPASAQSVTLADRTANAVDEVIIDFGAYGIYMLTNFNTSTGWSQLHAGDPVGINTGRFK